MSCLYWQSVCGLTRALCRKCIQAPEEIGGYLLISTGIADCLLVWQQENAGGEGEIRSLPDMARCALLHSQWMSCICAGPYGVPRAFSFAKITAHTF